MTAAEADAWDRAVAWISHHGQSRVPIDVIEDAFEYNPYSGEEYVYSQLAPKDGEDLCIQCEGTGRQEYDETAPGRAECTDCGGTGKEPRYDN